MWLAEQVRNKVRKDLDIDEDELVTDLKMWGFINDAVRDMTAEMLKLGIEDKYYETRAKISLVAGQEMYSLPTNIFVSKLYKIIHQRPTSKDVVCVRRLRGMAEYEKYHDANNYTPTNPLYYYKILNEVDSPKLAFIPTPQVAENLSMTLWYARKPTVVTTGTSPIDTPEELISYIITFVKVECLKADLGNPLLAPMMQELERIRKVMVDTLTDLVHDTDNTIEPDFSHYRDMGVM